MPRPMNYVDPPDVPEGMTLCEYRRACREARDPGPARRRAAPLRWWLRRRSLPADPAPRGRYTF